MSPRDQHTLAQIEAELRASDPELARRMDDDAAAASAQGPIYARPRRRVVLSWLTIGAVLLATAFAVRSADVAFLGVAVILANVSVWTAALVAGRLRRRTNRSRIGDGRNSSGGRLGS
ncbi:DUF3040 domain-containing protein [Actinospica durhamensis]|uniref:DUF3040 domain-containing protein n=1 Tax=Actinospica durhamensis TaxID=1508375 RepID=A0A941ET65_9ACTN|nr:DUF3040 domain-containing protein [Actinospica durhamensis]MBR7833389.1 DUF3040 domain-containing protein [Actinospica durhamensis]